MSVPPETTTREDGFALPTAMFLLLGLMAILSVGAIAAVNTQRGTERDLNSKQALAAAESAAEIALHRYNMASLDLSEGLPCLDTDGNPAARQSALIGSEVDLTGGWCAQVPTGDPEGAAYWVRPYTVGESTRLEVIAQAVVGETARRLRTLAALEVPPPAGYGRVGGENVVGIDSVHLSGDAQIEGRVGSNGTVHLEGSANVCGPIRTGDGQSTYTTDNSSSINPPAGCSRPSETGNKLFVPPELPADIAVNNSNHRLAALDPVPGDIWQRGNVDWNPTSRHLTVKYSQLALQGDSPYFLCRLDLQGGSTLSMEKAGGPVQIFFDSPANCGGETRPMSFANGTTMVNNGYVPGLFIVGSDEINTTINPSGGAAALEVVIYAPRSEITIDGNFFLSGAVIGKSIGISGGADVRPYAGLEDYELPIPGETVVGSIRKLDFAECRSNLQPSTTETPATGC